MKFFIPILFCLFAVLSCTEEVIVEKTLYDTVYVDKEPVVVIYTQYDTLWVDRPVYDTVFITKDVIVTDTIYVTNVVIETVTKLDTVYVTDTEYVMDTVYITQTVERIDTVYKEVVRTETVIQVDTVYVQQVDTLEYSNTITVPIFWKKYVENFLAAVEECNFPLFARDVVIDTTWREPVPIYGGDTIIYAYSYMVGGTTGYDGYWYVNIDIAKKDCAEAIIYRELMHRLAGWPYAGDWRLWTHFIGDTDIIGYDPDKDQIMYQNWPYCLEDLPVGDYYRLRYVADLMPCLR